MSDDKQIIGALPACLGGEPVRPVSADPAVAFRTTPEKGAPELRSIKSWLDSAPTWEPDETTFGEPLAEGLAIDTLIADALGGEVAAFAAEFGAMQAPGQDVTVVPNNNGTRIITAVFAALTKWAPEMGLRLPKVGSEVIVPAATWQATAGALLSRNLVPVLVDVDPDTLTIDPAAVEAAITDKTVAIIPVHLYGRMADMDAIMAIAAKHDLFVLEDCAHAHGAVFADGRGAGTVGHAGTFSFQGSKSLAGGEGGALISTHRGLATQVASIVTCGRRLPGTKALQADNDRMPAVVAALLRAQLVRFPEQNARRARVFAELDAAASELRGVTPLARQASVLTPPTYKVLVRIVLGEFGDMALAQARDAFAAELSCEVWTIYEPLTNSPLYDPHSDESNRIDPDYWAAIDPARYQSPVADEAFATVLAIEHAAGLDPEFPRLFALAVRKIQAHAGRIKAELTA